MYRPKRVQESQNEETLDWSGILDFLSLANNSCLVEAIQEQRNSKHRDDVEAGRLLHLCPDVGKV